MKNWKQFNDQDKNMEVPSDTLSQKELYLELAKQYSPDCLGDEILVYHLSVLYVRLSRLWSAEMEFLTETHGLSQLKRFPTPKVTKYGAQDLEALLTKYEPAILRSISKTKNLLTKRRKNLSKFLQNT